MISTVALLLAFVAAQVAGPIPQGTAYDFDAPAPGTADDHALWKAAADANNQVLIERSRASRLQTRASTGNYEARLDALVGKPGAKEAATVRERLLSAWVENVGINTRQWPVDPTRACRNQVLTFESAMRDDNPARRGASLPEARQNVKTCLDKARLVLSALIRSSDQLEASLAEADRLLAAAGTAAAAADPGASAGKAAGEGVR